MTDKETQIRTSCNELAEALVKQHRNITSQTKLKIEEIKLRKEVLLAREGVRDLREE